MIRFWQFLKYKFIDVPDPVHADLELALRSVIAAAIAVVLYFVCHFSLNTAIFLVLGAYLLALTNLGITHRARFIMMVAIGLFFMANTFFVTLIAWHLWALLLYIFIVSYLLFQLQSYGPNVIIPVIIGLIFALIAGTYPGDLTVAWQRFLGAAMGFGISFVCAYVFWPYRPSKLLRRLDRVTKERTVYMMQWVLNDFLCGNVSSRRVSQAKEHEFGCLMQMRQLLAVYPNSHCSDIVEYRSSLFGQVIMLSQLLSEPYSRSSCTEILPDIARMRSLLVEVCDENITDKTAIHQQLEAEVDALEQRFSDDNDITSLCFLIKRMVQLTKEGGRFV